MKCKDCNELRAEYAGLCWYCKATREDARRYDPLQRLAGGTWTAYGCTVAGCTEDHRNGSK